MKRMCRQCGKKQNRSPKNYVIAAAAVILFLVSFVEKYAATDVLDTALESENSIQQSIEKEETPLQGTLLEHTYEFRKPRYLTEHFEKHGEEFPYDTEEAYLQGANMVINNPEALHKLEAEDGDDVYYVEATNEFVVVSTDGYIRTYFKADMDYYNRQ